MSEKDRDRQLGKLYSIAYPLRQVSTQIPLLLQEWKTAETKENFRDWLMHHHDVNENLLLYNNDNQRVTAILPDLVIDPRWDFYQMPDHPLVSIFESLLSDDDYTKLSKAPYFFHFK